MDQQEIDIIIDFVKDGKYPVSMKNEKNIRINFRRKCQHFVFDGELFYVHSKNGSGRLKVISKDETNGLIRSVHDAGQILGASKS